MDKGSFCRDDRECFLVAGHVDSEVLKLEKSHHIDEELQEILRKIALERKKTIIISV